MTRDVLQEFLRQQPFTPFEITLSTGERKWIEHPELAGLARSTLWLFSPKDDCQTTVTSTTLSLLNQSQRPLARILLTAPNNPEADRMTAVWRAGQAPLLDVSFVLLSLTSRGDQFATGDDLAFDASQSEPVAVSETRKRLPEQSLRHGGRLVVLQRDEVRRRLHWPMRTGNR